jgi:hypothetical protein
LGADECEIAANHYFKSLRYGAERGCDREHNCARIKAAKSG